MLTRDEQIGCRVLLNPNVSSLRCGDRINNLNWNQSEGSIQLCPMCKLRKENLSLIEMLNRKKS